MNASHAITSQSSSTLHSRLGRPGVTHRRTHTLVALGMSLGPALAALPASAMSLANPGFEVNALVPYSSLLSNPIATGVWGHESSAIVGAVSPIVPAAGAQMLQMHSDGLGTTQAGQFIAVAGNTAMTFGALFNADLPAAQANVVVTFFSGNTYSSLMPPSSTQLLGPGLTLDAVASTWQPVSVTGAVPLGAQYALAQVFYSSGSLVDANGALGVGYVDQAFAAAVPEPSTYGLLALGLALLGFKRRRQPDLDRG